MTKWYRDATDEFWRMSKQHGGLQPEIALTGAFGKVQMLVFAEDQYGLKRCTDQENVVLNAFDAFRPRGADEYQAWYDARTGVLELFDRVAEHARVAAAITAGRDDLDEKTVTTVLTEVERARAAEASEEG